MNELVILLQKKITLLEKVYKYLVSNKEIPRANKSISFSIINIMKKNIIDEIQRVNKEIFLGNKVSLSNNYLKNEYALLEELKVELIKVYDEKTVKKSMKVITTLSKINDNLNNDTIHTL